MTLGRTLVAALALAILPPVYGTQTPRMSFEQLVSGADAIVHGTIVRSWTAWDDARRAIWTHYEIEVADALKGEPGGKLVISEPGGELDGVHMRVVGAPRYEVGEEVVLFAAPTPIGYRRTSGWGQGRFEVTEAASGKSVSQARVAATVVDSAERDASGSSLKAVNGAGLEEFKARIREEVARQSR